MTINQEAQTITWKPTASQIGENHVAITASDGVLETTVHFTVTVYGSTTGGPAGGSNETEKTGTSTDSGTAGGDSGTVADSTGESVRFIDLGNHAWAADSINALADEGIIKGTTANTYSPAKNITRADFAILLVRAFGLQSENTENFTDVLDTDYFASELAVARNS